jgi:hypothetical protein
MNLRIIKLLALGTLGLSSSVYGSDQEKAYQILIVNESECRICAPSDVVHVPRPEFVICKDCFRIVVAQNLRHKNSDDKLLAK